MKQHVLTLFLLVISFSFYAQYKINKIKLPAELNEISGLEKFNDSTLIAINDSGNSPTIFFITLKGKLIKKTLVSNATNIDWEDLTIDNKGNLYIADAGNNSNSRKNLVVLKIDMNRAFDSDSIAAEKIYFTYKNQLNFSSNATNRAHDSEALFWFNDSLYLLTKLRSKPKRNKEMNGSFQYGFPTIPGEYSLIPNRNYWTGGSNKLKHQVTACDNFQNKLAILTYGAIYFYSLETSSIMKKESIRFLRLTQKEALVYFSENKLLVAAEKNWLLSGPFLYTIEFK